MHLEAKVIKDTLSDGSEVWNVKYVDGGLTLTIGCIDQDAAESLAEGLNAAAWISADIQ